MVSPAPPRKPRKRPRAAKALDTATAQFGEGAESTPPTAGPPATSTEETHQKLLRGEPVRFDAEKQTEKQREVPTEWVAEALREGHRVELKDAVLTGRLDLQSAHVEQEFLFLGGEVRGPVNAIYARFGSWVVFHAVRFQGFAHFRGARFAAELNCSGTYFVGGVTFQDSIIEGSLIAIGAQFGSSKEDATSLNGCEIRCDATFVLAVFHGPAQFLDLTVGKQANFSGARFEHGAVFDQAEIGGGFFFTPEGEQRTEFGGDVRFSGVKVGGQANFGMVQFKQEVSFQSATVEGEAGFVGVEFQKAASFQRAEFKAGLYFSQPQSSPATFGGETQFHGVKVGGQANFSGARFEQGVAFEGAEIGGDFFFRPQGEQRVEFGGEARFLGVKVGGKADFSGARFDQEVAFEGAEIGGDFFFRPQGEHRVQFGGEARFLGVKVGGQANFDEARFAKPAFFEAALFSGSPFFREAEFSAPVSFVAARFQLAAEFQGAHFQGPANFDYARFEQEAHFAGAKFSDQLELRDARMTTLSFQEGGMTAHFDKKSKVDLLGCTYDRLEIDGWRKLMDRQSGFNPRPWSHLEKVLRAAGQDRQADDVYLQRRRVEHKQKWQRGEFGPWLLDSIHALVANYGIRPYQLLYTPILILLLGTALFFHPDATHRKFSGQTPSDPQQLTRTVPGATGEFTAVDAVRLSVRYFLPVEVPLATRWEASNKQYGPLRFSDYATGMKLAGWILVPLGIAALTGLLRRVAP